MRQREEIQKLLQSVKPREGSYFRTSERLSLRYALVTGIKTKPPASPDTNAISHR
jgi:hypothetical protein